MLLGLATLTMVYVAEYFGMHPCKLCLFQRIPYWVISGTCSFTLALRIKARPSWAAMVVVLSMLASIMLSGFHVAVEQG